MSWRALLLAVFAATPAAAIEVALVSPEGGEAVFGRVELAAQVYPLDTAVKRVDFFVDGQFHGRVEAAPWELLVDIGEENSEHEFTVVAHAAAILRPATAARLARFAVLTRSTRTP